MKKMTTTKKITYLGMGIALYIILSLTIKLPLVNRIKTDFGYLVFGAYLNLFGIPATIVGVVGCIVGNLLIGGSLPIAWAIGQLFVGIVLGYCLPKISSTWLKIGLSILVMWIGIDVIKTLLEVWMFKLPLWAKFLSNMVAFIADTIPLIIGILISKKIKK